MEIFPLLLFGQRERSAQYNQRYIFTSNSDIGKPYPPPIEANLDMQKLQSIFFPSTNQSATEKRPPLPQQHDPSYSVP